ncbi:Zn-ribbon domain-containing OB-fold protein [Neobacillus niacini]|uniref:Zn-ribbon domain-containing OB-fold protein n=1 Tax=Neobacillus niacini TaxID=86668 RepID=UPI002FFE3E55
MSEKIYKKPLPKITRQSKPFWDAAKRHELMVQQCAECGWYHLPAAELCPKCSGELEWVHASGKGKVHTFTIFHVPYHPAFKDELPYNVSIIELEEGPLLLSNVINCKNEDINTGMPVQVTFEDVTPEISLHRFEPV